MQELNRQVVPETGVTDDTQASDFKLMHPGRRSWKSPYRIERLTDDGTRSGADGSPSTYWLSARLALARFAHCETHVEPLTFV